jgi:hypothetical protein
MTIRGGTHMKMWLEGKPEQVRPFVQELERTRSVEVFRSEPVQKVNDDQEVVVCLVRWRPGKRAAAVELHTECGGVVRIPFLNMISADMGNGQTVLAGWTYDIFA